MAKINFIHSDGAVCTVNACGGITLMEAAVGSGVEGIDAMCGGACACATCHIYIEDPWLSAVGSPGTDERDLLADSDFLRPNSRLACQIRVSEAFDGMTVRVAPRSA